MAVHPSRRRRLYLAVAGLSALVGLVCAGFNSGIGPFPPNDEANGLQIASATTHVMVDRPASSPSVAVRRALPQDVETSVKHAELLGRVMVTPPVLNRIAARCGLSPGAISGLGRITSSVPLVLAEPDSERRASEIQGSSSRYRIEVQGRPSTPVIDVFTQAPGTVEAECLANGAVVALSDYLRQVAERQGADEAGLVSLRQIGSARSAVVNRRAPLAIAMLTFLVTFALTAGGLLGLIWLRRRRLASRVSDSTERPQASNGGSPETNGDSPETNGGASETPLPSQAIGWPQLRRHSGGAARSDDNWPRTTRVLPWMLAGFIAILWLIPFNAIKVNASLPIDLTLDRLVLPVIALAWVVALVGRAKLAPQLRLTWIHAALGALLICAFLSVVLDARYLNQTLELELSLKKLPLIVSYVAVFVIVASSVRRAEVRAFLSYTLILAVVCAFGMIYEYRLEQNLFWDLSGYFLPDLFVLQGQVDGVAVDSIGRTLVRGPGEVPLEAVAMLTLALPIALVRLMDTKRWLERIVYGLAACALMAAVFATYRKSAIVAPAAVVLTLLFFRRRELLKLAPLAIVFVVIAVTLSPGALGSTLEQFTRSDREALPTVSDRSSDYDAVRPDVWSNLAFGRGWGSYNHESYRILDSEILQRTIETGVLGLVAFLLVGVAVIASARKTIGSRDPTSAPVALIGAAIGVAFIVLATLFDILSFPHAPYIFLYMTGLVAVMIARPARTDEREPVVPPVNGRPDDSERALPPRAKEPLASLR